ncbi:MAG: hypothetical protein HC842_01940 [Cytophagales bacterium]|nr:hypothetical protein [Cytophagales bacterium]
MDGSAAFFNKALKLDQENQEYWLCVAEAEYKIGNLSSSIDAYEEALMLDDTCLDAWLDLSYIYFERGDYQKAIELIVKSLDALPEEAELYYRATVYLIHAAQFKQAFNFLENALILDFDKHSVLFEFFPKLETQKALFKIIEQFRKENP